MDDIEALCVLRRQKDVLKKLTKLDNRSTSFEEYQETVSQTMTETQTNIEKVIKYAIEIKEQLENVRELVKHVSVLIGEKLKDLLKKHKFRTHERPQEMEKIPKPQKKGVIQEPYDEVSDFRDMVVLKNPRDGYKSRHDMDIIKDRPSTVKSLSQGKPQTSVSQNKSAIDLQVLKQAQIMQRLAQQQQELMEFIAKTETLIMKIESDAPVSESDIAHVKNQMNKWCKVLETIAEQESRKKEEKEEEIRRKEDEKRKKKGEEERKKRQAKEEREKREEDKRQKTENEKRKKSEQKDAEREKKEADERKKRELKEKEQRKKTEKEEADRRKKEEEEQKNREQKEKERQKQEADRRKKEEEERKNREQKEKERQKQEADRRKKDEEEGKHREQKEKERQKQEEEERGESGTEEASKQNEYEEQREAEEKIRKQEIEKKRKDWKKWPHFIYKNRKPNKFQQEICCVIITMPNGIKENDFICQGSDADEDLDKCLETNDEETISSVVTIQNKKVKTEFELPIRVYVPIVSHDQSLVPTLKFRVEGQKWRYGKPLRDKIHLPNVEDVSFVGIEIPVKKLEVIQCVAIARYTNYEIEVDEEGKTFEPEVDRNIKVKFQRGAFAEKTNVTTKALSCTNADIKMASKKHKELQNIKIAGSYINISCEDTTMKDSDLEMYDLGFIVDKKLRKNQSVNQETLNRCSRWLVNSLNPDEDVFPLDDVFDSDFVEDLKTQETDGDKNRMILRHLHDSNSDSDFDKFLVGLESCHPILANRINSVKNNVKLCRNAEDSYSEDDFASDFDPDFEKKEGTLCIVSKMTGKSWNLVPVETSLEHPKARFVKLPSGNDKYQFLGLVVPDNMTEEDICRAAEILEGLFCVTYVSIICRQKHQNLHDVIIECVRSENVTSTMKALDSIGYNEGPAASSEFGVVDGEAIEIKFESNLYLERLKHSPLKIKFYKNLQLDRYSEHLEVVSKAEQGEDIAYHGYLKYSVSPGRLSSSRTGSLVVYIPKPLEELLGNFPYTIDVPVKALAKFIAWQLTRTNSNSTKWVVLGGYLTDRDQNLYYQICKNIDQKATKAQQRERCEQYILYWANHHAPSESDKVEKIIASHHDAKLESEAHQFIKPYLPGKGIFSNDSLEKMAFAIAGEWESMARQLGFTNDEINVIETSQPADVKKTLRMLDLWRLSDNAIQKGTDLVKNFHETAKSAKCGAKLLTIISKNVN